MNTAGAVLDDDQRAETTERHRVHMDEVDCEDAEGLGYKRTPQAWAIRNCFQVGPLRRGGLDRPRPRPDPIPRRP